MIKILFLSPYPHDEVASQRFRFEQYFSVLKKHNFKIRQKSFYNTKTYKILYSQKRYIQKSLGIIWGFLKRIIHVFYTLEADYVFIHREITPIGPPVFEWIIAKIIGKKIIYDFDDAIWLQNTSKENIFVSRLKNHQKFFNICKWSYKVSCCNEYLADNARKKNTRVYIIPTTIDTEIWSPLPKSTNEHKLILGWTGTHSTLPYLTSIKSILERIVKKHPQIGIRMICNKKPDWTLPGLEFIPWNKSTEIEDLAHIDIGLMPLPSSPWAEGKCGFKILQYFALQIPALASPVGINSDLIRHGDNGYLCNQEESWIESIELLMNSKELRDQIGKNGRDTLVEYYSLAANTTNFLDLFV